MPRPQNKEDLLKAAEENFAALNKMIDSLTEKEMNTPFDFSAQPSKKEAHWARDKNVRDVLVHLYEWHMLSLKFVENNKGKTDKGIAFLPTPYTWKTYGAMNQSFWERHQNTPLSDARNMLSKSHQQVMDLIRTFTDEELFTKKHFSWTGTSNLGGYFVSNTSSHYDWALKKLKAHKKNCSL